MESELLTDFTLDSDAISTLISLERDLVNADIEETDNPKKKNAKKKWRDDWMQIIQNGLFEIKKDNPGQNSPEFLFPIEVEKKLNVQREKRLQSGMLLLELVCFQPYFKITENKSNKSIRIDPKVRKKYLREKAKKLGYEENKAQKLDAKISSTKNKITKKWLKIGLATGVGVAICAGTIGSAGPMIGGLIGSYAAGLTGISAVNTGFLFIGGGSIAFGGLGIAGATAILVGGGAIVGMGVGFPNGNFINSINSGDTLLQSIKLEVALQEIIANGNSELKKTNDILKSQRKAIENLEREIEQVSAETKIEKKRVKDLGKSLKIMRESLKRNQSFIKNLV
jgi:hypothetical protein